MPIWEIIFFRVETIKLVVILISPRFTRAFCDAGFIHMYIYKNHPNEWMEHGM